MQEAVTDQILPVHQVEHKQDDMNIVIVGHVDHGKSTIIGRLLTDTGSLPKGKLEDVKERCLRNSKPFEYAFLLDALKDEQAQGITIDSARCFFKTATRKYIIIDAPGHIEFLKNMVTGASRAEAALLVIDANEGVKENTKRHGYMLSMLGIKQIAVLINKMDLINYDKTGFDKIVSKYSQFLKQINIKPLSFIPVSGMKGDNIAGYSQTTPWYSGLTVLEQLDSFEAEQLPEDKPFRMPVQDVYKFTRDGDDRRIIAGTIESGRIQVGDEVIIYPLGKKSKINTIETFNKGKLDIIGTGWATGFTLTEQIYVKRGDIVTILSQPKPKTTSRFKVNLFWLGQKPLIPKKEYFLKLGTAKVGVKVEEIIRVLDASTLQGEKKEFVGRHDVAECILKTEKMVAFDLAHESAQTSKFVIVDNYEISGGGIIVQDLEDDQSAVREQVILRNYKWERSEITVEERTERFNQKPTLILITGPKGIKRKTIAKAIEKKLFSEGKVVYFLGIGNVLYGVDADIKNINNNHREEHLRRLAEVAHIMLDAGIILIVTAIELTQEDVEIIKTVINQEKIGVIWVGEEITTDISCDLVVQYMESDELAVIAIKNLLQDRGIIYKAW